ncbi:uncharacterized protein PAC_09410 [Phialocephala subalpina]|uniref:Zn(2)-C6 fungal-type domain-containing protein n=1 Tax=Phialocephala subalpina TaxID=576137 RepID=A0A1L7X3C0_9HELO|nr:uncharacterized protein PAC_09410 [Phialocephala subalpina]
MDLNSGNSPYSPNDLSDGTIFQLSPSDASSETLRSTQSWKSVTPTALPAGRTPQNISTTHDEPSKKVEKRGRKGHTKSRTGCLNCKRARIKCKENRPSCDYCAHRDLKCEWPDVHIKQMGTVIRRTPPAASVPVNPQTQQPVYSTLDFRLFYHFIQKAYPHYPIGNDSVWTHEIPAIAPKFDFLLNAMLALAASDIYSLQTPDDKGMHLTAMTYRVKSIESLNKAVSAGIESFEKGNAILATCFSLLFQSTLLNEALGDYFMFVRGCISVGIQMGMKRMKFIFTKVFGDEQLESVEDALQAAPLINPDAVARAIRSLEKMGPLCKTKVEIDMYGVLLSMARTLVTSSRDAYMQQRKVYTLFSYEMQQDEFREFVNPENEVCRLLQAHFVAMQLIMTPISKAEWKDRKGAVSGDGDGTTGRWLQNLHSRIPVHLLEYYEWTLWVDAEVQKGKIFNGVYD